MFLQVVTQFLLGPIGCPQPFPVKRRPQLVVQRRGPGKFHLVFPQHREMAAGHFLVCRRQGIFCSCRRFLWNGGFHGSSALRSSRSRRFRAFRGGCSQVFRDLRPAVVTEFGMIRQFGATVHTKHGIILSFSVPEAYRLILWALAFSWRACISVRTRLARSTWLCSLRTS